jgi:hypothetical protein
MNTKDNAQPNISKRDMQKADPNLDVPTQDVEENLARGEDEVIPDSDDIPGGLESTLNQKITPRPDLMQADANALQQSKGGRSLYEIKKKKKTKKD